MCRYQRLDKFRNRNHQTLISNNGNAFHSSSAYLLCHTLWCCFFYTEPATVVVLSQPSSLRITSQGKNIWRLSPVRGRIRLGEEGLEGWGQIVS